MTPFEVKCPTCKRRFYVSGYVPKWTICDRCGVQFETRKHKPRNWFGLRKLFTKGSD